MRHYAGFRLPRGAKGQLLAALAAYPDALPLADAHWRQALLTELLGPSAAREWVRRVLARVERAVGQAFDAGEFSAVLHWGSGEEVPRHADNMARTCFLIPLRASKTLEVFENWSVAPLAGKRLIRFSDFEDHGLRNPHRGHFSLLTLSRDRV